MNPFVQVLEEVDGIILNQEDLIIPQEEDIKYPAQELFQGDVLGLVAESETRFQSQEKKKSQEEKAREYELFKHIKECLIIELTSYKYESISIRKAC